MTLKETIQKDLNEAIKKKEELNSSVLRMLLAAVLNKEKEKRFKLTKEKPDLKEEQLVKESQLADEEMIEVISSEVKKRKEAVADYERGERQELAEKEKKEIEILQKYLPEQLSEEEIKKLAKEAVKKTGAKEQKDMGKVMAELMSQVKGKADGTLVSRVVKDLLAVKK
ncbi:hypothetical protein ES703_03452 [subsurface metagenome]